jgi:transcriptional regulator with XRE-family HTH domain
MCSDQKPYVQELRQGLSLTMDERRIVENIKRMRQSKKMSLEKLAKVAGLTKGYISKIEHSQKAPPISTLLKIANALGTEASFLIAESSSELPENISICIVRKNERREVVSRGTFYGYRYESLAYKKIGKSMEPYVLEPAFDERAIFSHDGEEFMYVLEGIHEFVFNNHRYILKEGDSVYYDSKIPHSGRSVGRKKAKVLMVGMPYPIWPPGLTSAKPVARSGVRKK